MSQTAEAQTQGVEPSTAQGSPYAHEEHYLSDESFAFMPMGTLDSADFSGRARIAYGDTDAEIDLVITSVSFTCAENHQTTTHIGDTYSTVFFGKAPIEVNVQASLPDSLENFGKTNLLNAYKNCYRASAVARFGKAPSLHCKGLVFTGPFTKLSISEDSDRQDTVAVTFTMLAMLFAGSGDNSQIAFDYAHGLDAVYSDDAEFSAIGGSKAAVTKGGVTLNRIVAAGKQLFGDDFE